VIVVVCCLAESSALRAASGGRSDPAPVLYPHELDERPGLPSPYLAEDATEIVTAVLKNGKYVCIPVTVENGKPLHYSYRVPFACGKDRQLHVNRDDFPTLAQTGLHADAELDATTMITGVSVDLITYIGRPGRFSGAGFLADDETILSVLKGDNNLVRKLGLTHPQMAKPLYHVWNIILQDIERGTFKRFSSIPRFFYNDQEITLRAESTKGWQISIFQDEIQGTFDIHVRRTLTAAENSFLRRMYRGLSDAQMTELQEKLTHLRLSEMLPYYIMGYGFYEGHTDFRADPIAIACIFGLRSIEEIENAFPGRLHATLTHHFTEPVRRDARGVPVFRAKSPSNPVVTD
jgi:hypothetical protein